MCVNLDAGQKYSEGHTGGLKSYTVSLARAGRQSVVVGCKKVFDPSSLGGLLETKIDTAVESHPTRTGRA
jgi:hypothetical protein